MLQARLGRGRSRPGAIAPLTAVMLIFLVAMVAFAVDMGWMTLTQNELQSSADAAALAGTGPLLDGYVLYNLPLQTTTKKQTILADALTNARTAARQNAGYNAAGGV